MDDEMPELEEISMQHFYETPEQRAGLRNQGIRNNLESSFREYFVTHRRARNNIMR
jgi:hypothetical protein